MRDRFVSKVRLLGVLAVSLALFSAQGWASTISWSGAVTGGAWGTNTNWTTSPGGTHDVPGFSDDVTIITGIPTTAGTYTLGGDRFVNSLTISSKTTINAGTPATSTLTILTGNLSTTGSGWTYGGIAAKIAIASGANATWSINHGSDAFYVNGIAADGGVTISKAGGNLLTFNTDNSSTLHASWNIGGTKGIALMASNALGDGLVTFTGSVSNPAVTFGSASSAVVLNYANDWNMNGQNVVWSAYGASVPGARTININGNITGSGTLTKYSSNSDGILILAGINNTFSGNITHPRGGLILNGYFTNLGNITQTVSTNPSWLSGIGNVGMGMNNKITLAGTSTIAANLAPGSSNAVGSIGTLTIGTNGYNNSIEMNAYSRFLVDVDATSSDLLALTGTLKLAGAATNALYITGTLGTLPYTLATYTAIDSGKFGKVYFNGVEVTTPEVAGSIGGTHQLVYSPTSLTLVPEPATMALLVLGGLGLLARRRNRA